MTMNVTHRVCIGELAIDPLTLEGALDAIETLVRKGQGGTIFTPNVDHVVQVEDNLLLREAYASANLSLVDGMPVMWAARMMGQPLPEKISGSDLVVPLMRRAARCGWRVYFLGGAEGVSARAKERLEREILGLQIVGVASPRIAIDESAEHREEVVAAIRAARPDLVLVALGAPKQELWSHAVKTALRPAVVACVGASLDFVAGTVSRAPAWMSANGLEWLYRLAQEPRRLWRRYLVDDPKFALIVLRMATRRR